MNSTEVVGHGEEENAGRPYFLVEGTDHHVHFIYHTSEIVDARQNGKLKPDSFVRFSAQAIQEKFNLRIQDFGDAKRLLDNREYFQRKARDLMRRGIIPVENGFGGWLGEYEAALRQAASAIQNKTSEERENHLPR